jgi:2-polyprenyl-3-methyl-5-hydroxy-6-metoxy-1,4-benzoquinol methylase
MAGDPRMDKLGLAELPAELAERIREEAVENDELYRRRPIDDLSRIHYCHSEMMNWTFGQIGNLPGAEILDIGIGDGYSSVLMALEGPRVTGIEVSAVALARAELLARRYGWI